VLLFLGAATDAQIRRLAGPAPRSREQRRARDVPRRAAREDGKSDRARAPGWRATTPRSQNAPRRHTTDTKRKSCVANCRIVAALTSAFADSPQTLRARATTVDASLRGAYRPSRDHPFS